MPAVRFRIKGTKTYVEPVNSYAAASTKRRTSSWGGINGGPNVPSRSLPMLRNRSRDAVRNDGQADGIVATLVSNIVGAGIRPHFASSDEGLNKEQSELFEEWCAEAHTGGQVNYYGLQALAARSMVEGGEVFGRMRFRRLTDPLAVPLQIQLLESEHCPADKTEAYGGNDIHSGVEFTPFDARAAYWFLDQHPDEIHSIRGRRSGVARRVPASNVFHLMQVRRPGQVRGEPWLTRAIEALNEFHDYQDAERIRKKTGAMFAGFRRRPLPEGITAEDLAEEWGEDAEIDDGVGNVNLEPGTMQILDPGEEIEFSSPVDVGGNYDVFVKAQNRSIARAGYILYEQLSGDYSAVNDRTLRAAMLEFRRQATMWQHHTVIFGMCRPVLRTWLQVVEMAGLIRRPRGMSDRDFNRVRHVPTGWEYLHPTQDVSAKVMAIRAGLESRDDVVTARGGDAQQVDATQAAGNARAERHGLSYDSDGRRAASDPTKEAGSGDDDGGSGNGSTDSNNRGN